MVEEEETRPAMGARTRRAREPTRADRFLARR